MKKILCLALTAAVLMLASCSGNEDTSSATLTVSSAVSYLAKEDSIAFKHFEDNNLKDGMTLNLTVKRHETTDECVVNAKDGIAHISYTAYGATRNFYTDGAKHYELDGEKKSAYLITGTTPDAIYLALTVLNTDYSLFLEAGTKKLDSVSYKTETFSYEPNSEDKLVYYITDDNSIAFIEYVSSSDANYNIMVTVNSVKNTVDEALLTIPKDYTLVNE